MAKKADSYYMPFYVERWLASTAGMTAAQKGVYIDLLALQFDNPDGLVTDNQVAFTVAPRDATATAEILASKFERIDGGYRNARLEERRAFHDKKREAGRRGGQAKAQATEQARRASGKAPSPPRTADPPADRLAKGVATDLAKREAKPLPQSGIPKRNTEYQNQNHGRNTGIPQSAPLNGKNEQEIQRQAIALAVQAARQLPDPTAPNDRRLIAAAAVLAVTELTEHWFFDSLGGVTNVHSSRPYAKLHAVYRARAREMYQADFDALAAALAIPRDFYDSMKEQLGTPTP